MRRSVTNSQYTVAKRTQVRTQDKEVINKHDRAPFEVMRPFIPSLAALETASC